MTGSRCRVCLWHKFGHHVCVLSRICVWPLALYISKLFIDTKEHYLWYRIKLTNWLDFFFFFFFLLLRLIWVVAPVVSVCCNFVIFPLLLFALLLRLPIIDDIWWNVFWFIYSYVAVCMFCAVRCVIIISFSLLFSNYSCFLTFFLCFVVVCVCFLFYALCGFAFFKCIVSPFVLSVFYFCTSLPTTATGRKSNCSK